MTFIYILGGAAIWGCLLLILFLFRTKSNLHRMPVDMRDRRSKRWIVATLIVVILACTLPMGIDPIWNGKAPAHRNQYEKITEGFLKGHLYFDYGDPDPKLLALKNPYDPAARKESGAEYPHDHVFYKGHYYMYFGVVPVVLLFLPFRVLTGHSLTTYHATQIFVALYICGVFALFYMWVKKFFQKLPLSMYLIFATAISCVSVWYSIEAPALYCTAITGGLCMEIWSLYFFMKAVWVEEREWRSIGLATLGSLFGALAFGCRPPVALANLLVLPMLAVYLRKWKFSLKRLGQLALAALPYLVVAAALMAYNYARFEDPFEFGLSYMFTVADQTSYGEITMATLTEGLRSILDFFVGRIDLSDSFPFLTFGGALVNFPILVFSLIALFRKPLRQRWREQRLCGVIAVLCLVPLMIGFIDSMWTPILLERYHMDIYWLLGLLCFLSVGNWHDHLSERSGQRFGFGMSLWAILTICTCVLFYIAPNDSNITARYPEALTIIKRVLTFGLYGG